MGHFFPLSKCIHIFPCPAFFLMLWAWMKENESIQCPVWQAHPLNNLSTENYLFFSEHVLQDNWFLTSWLLVIYLCSTTATLNTQRHCLWPQLQKSLGWMPMLISLKISQKLNCCSTIFFSHRCVICAAAGFWGWKGWSPSSMSPHGRGPGTELHLFKWRTIFRKREKKKIRTLKISLNIE